ncbi:MAG: tagaturonate epimerase family protein, partial [Spirochaetes bacterium]|nr:tagaturonate epimerase family protein [Spirochaetota bacterium]
MIAGGLLEELSRARPGKRVTVSRQSAAEADGVSFAIVEIDTERKLGISGPDGAAAGFEVEQDFRAGSEVLSLCPLIHANAERLRRIFPHAAPSPLARKAGSAGAPGITFGVGDRLGVAGPGHIRAFR